MTRPSSISNLNHKNHLSCRKLHFEGFPFMILMNFLKNSVTSPVFELEQCSLHINGVELDQDCTGDQIPP